MDNENTNPILLNISDIQHFSTGDGDGIRTTVFFKGCNLRCPWCHNPETISALPQRLRQGGHDKLCGRKLTVGEVASELMWDYEFYVESGGGVTLSGGEVMLQSQGAAALCAVLRERGISIVIDTAGNVPYESFERLNGFGVEYYYDWKANRAEYESVIGGDWERIHGNLKRLIADGQRVRIRIPFIPGFNDSPEYIDKMCASLNSANVKRVELLPFHRLGSSKYTALGLDYRYKDTKPPTKDEISEAIRHYARYFDVSVGG